MEPHTGKLTDDTAQSDSLAALRRFARTRPNVERCELCGCEIGGQHSHLLNRSSRQIACSCDACAILFCNQESAQFLRVPKRILKLEGFAFSDAEWDAMTVPINMAFFLRGQDDESTALYPSPAGVMQSMLPLPSWPDLTRSDRSIASVEPEVEALLVNRLGSRHACFIVPIDVCYHLVGLIRTKWRGLSGGPEVWQSIAEFFTSLELQARSVGEPAHA